MAAPGAEIVIPVGMTTLGLGLLFGHDTTFWIVVGSATALKMLSSDPVLDKDGEPLVGRHKVRQWFISFLSAIIMPFALTKVFAEILGVDSPVIEYGIAFGLVIVGEGLFRWLARASHNPEKLIEWAWKVFRGGGK